MTEDFAAAVEMALGIAQGVFDLAALVPDSVDLGSQLVFGPALLGSQVKEVVLLAVEGVQPLDVLLAERVAQPVVAANSLVKTSAYLGEPIARQAHGVAVVAHNGFFKHLYRDEGQVT